MFALLGDIQFDLITYFNSFDTQFGADYAEHSVIEGKPRLQFMGDKLDEVSIQLAFHRQFCDPEKELARLREAQLAHNAMALVLGNGDYKGWFVLTDVQANSQQMDKTGTLIALEVSITLREYVGDKLNPLPPPAIQAEVPPADAQETPPGEGEIQGPPAPVAPENPIAKAMSSAAEGIRAVVGYAKQASAAVKVAKEAVDLVKQMKDNPMAAIKQLPGLVGKMAQVAAPLEGLAPVLTELSEILGEVVPIVEAGDTAVKAVRNIQNTLAATNSGNLFTNLEAVGGELNTIGEALEAAAPNISKLTARMVTRAI